MKFKLFAQDTQKHIAAKEMKQTQAETFSSAKSHASIP
jgi:hypothetical protein